MTLLFKYLRPNETWELLCERVSSIMRYESERYALKEALFKKRFLLNSPALINAGRGGRNMMACHLLHIRNSIDGIMEAAKECAKVFKSGGGIGLEFSALSPAGTKLKYAPQGIASGPVSFMQIYNTVAEVIMEGGLRRAAIMATLNAEHADVLRFVRCKEEDGQLRNFNISVTLNDGPDAVKPEVWDAIVKHAHNNGEPGMVFLDNINAKNPTLNDFGRIIGVNACGELPLYDKGSCILGSIALPRVIEKVGDYAELWELTKLAVRALNRIIDQNHYPLPAIAQQTRKVRRIGIGIMGWDDLLKREGVPFGGLTALGLASEIARNMREAADEESWALAVVEGGYLPDRERNATKLAIAPTGHISRLAGVSPSIYPDYETGLSMTVEQHLDHIEAWQKYVDSAVSYTISFPNHAPVNLVDRIFRGAHERGLKSISVYRDGSRAGQPLGCKSEETCVL